MGEGAAALLLGTGAVVVGVIAWAARHEAERARAEAQAKERAFRAANGWTFQETMRDLTAAYDRDRDGRFAYQPMAGAALIGGEGSRTITRQWTDPIGSWAGQPLPAGSTVLRERTDVRTIEPALRRADADRDGVTSTAEYLQLLATFDIDHDGKLSVAEHDRAVGELASVVASSSTRNVGVVTPPPRPTPSTPAKR